MIIIKSDRVMEPFGIQLSRESEFALIAPSESSTEEVQGLDGEIDFGTTLKNGEYRLNGIIEHDGPYNRNSVIDGVVAKFLECMELTELTYEVKPNLITYARITGKPDFVPYPNFTRVNFDLKLDPFWYSNEKSLVGNGVIINEGTFETGLIIEVNGPSTNPTLTIGGKVLSYTGIVASGEKLVIDTERETVKNGNLNAMVNYNKVFPTLQAEESLAVVAGSNVIIKWRDKWI